MNKSGSMSIYQRGIKDLAGIDISRTSREDLLTMFNDILAAGIHGLCFSVYLEHQGPGSEISDLQVEERMQVIQPYCKWIRSFSCTDGNEKIARIAKKHGIKTLVGAWLGEDEDKNEEEIAGLIAAARAGYVDIAAVGNEVLLREELAEQKLIDYIKRVKEAVPDIAVGYVDAYYLFENFPAVSQACDVILTNCYPFWEGYDLQHSLLYLKEMYRRAQRAGQGKKVIISETGWPNRGTSFEAAEPSFDNALRYFINTYTWAEEESIEVFYFASFDENWKVDAEGDVGAYWGLWDKNSQLKYRK
jgi:glucan 1,3-beta-glucosidase